MAIFTLLPFDLTKWKRLENDELEKHDFSGQWSISIAEFQLYQTMELHVPQIFNPRFNLSFLLIVWDYGKIWKIMPDALTREEEDYQFSFGENNTRRIRTQDVLLLEKKKIAGSVNALILLLENGDENSVIESLVYWIEQSDFYHRIKEIKEKTFINEDDISSEMNNLICGLMDKIKAIDDFCIPLLSVVLEEQDLDRNESLRIENTLFSLQFDFLRFR